MDRRDHQPPARRTRALQRAARRGAGDQRPHALGAPAGARDRGARNPHRSARDTGSRRVRADIERPRVTGLARRDRQVGIAMDQRRGFGAGNGCRREGDVGASRSEPCYGSRDRSDEGAEASISIFTGGSRRHLMDPRFEAALSSLDTGENAVVQGSGSGFAARRGATIRGGAGNLNGGCMAEIRVEPQRGGRGRVWLLILLLLIVAAAVWYFATRQSGTTTGGATA